MLLAPVKSLNVPSMLTQLHTAMENKDLEALKKCVQELASVNLSFEMFIELLSKMLNKDKNLVFHEIITDAIRFGNWPILNYLFTEFEVDVNASVAKLFPIAIAAKQHDIIKELSLYASLDEKNVITGFFMADALDDKETINIIKAVLDQSSNEELEASSQMMKSNLSETLKDIKTKAHEKLTIQIASLQEKREKLFEELSSRAPSSDVQIGMNAVNEQLTQLTEHVIKHQLAANLVRYRYRLALVQLKSVLARQYKESEDFAQIISALDDLDFDEAKKAALRDDIEAIVNDELLSLYPLLEEKDISIIKDKINTLAQKGLSLDVLDEKISTLFKADLKMSLLDGANFFQNDALFEYFVNELSFEVYPELIDAAASANNVKVLQHLVSRHEYDAQDFAASFGVAVANDAVECRDIILEKMSKISPEMARDFARLMPEFEKENKHRRTTVLKSNEELLEEHIESLAKLKINLSKKNADSALIENIDKITEILESCKENLFKYRTLLTLPLLMAQMLSCKLGIDTSKQATLKEEADTLLQLVTQLSAENFLIEEDEASLDEIPEKIREYIYRQMNEDAIDKPNEAEYALYHEVKSQYQAKFNEACLSNTRTAAIIFQENKAILQADEKKNQDDVMSRLACYPILKALENYLIQGFSKDDLKVDFDDAMTEVELHRYYQNKFHSAWRYLFARPNPWLSPDAKWAENGASKIQAQDFELIAYFWLAASDENAEGTDDFTLQTRCEHFVDIIAQFAREYNNEGPVDDLEKDKPTCDLGVRKRAAQLLIGHPLSKQIKELNAFIMLKRIQAWFIAENENHDTLFSALEDLSEKEINQVSDALGNWIINCGDVDQIDTLILSFLKLDNIIEDEPSHEFGKCLKEDYGIEHLTDYPVEYQDSRYKNYLKLLSKVLKDPLKFFSSEIYNKVESLKKRSNVNKETLEENSQPAAILHTFDSQKKEKRNEWENNQGHGQLVNEPQPNKKKFG